MIKPHKATITPDSITCRQSTFLPASRMGTLAKMEAAATQPSGWAVKNQPFEAKQTNKTRAAVTPQRSVVSLATSLPNRIAAGTRMAASMMRMPHMVRPKITSARAKPANALGTFHVPGIAVGQSAFDIGMARRRHHSVVIAKREPRG